MPQWDLHRGGGGFHLLHPLHCCCRVWVWPGVHQCQWLAVPPGVFLCGGGFRPYPLPQWHLGGVQWSRQPVLLHVLPRGYSGGGGRGKQQCPLSTLPRGAVSVPGGIQYLPTLPRWQQLRYPRGGLLGGV